MAKILIADDSRFMRTIIKNILEKAGHTVVGEASNGNEAMEKYALLKPNLVFMDINMNEVSGIEGLKRIKILDSKANVIMCSSMGQEIMIKECLSEGALDFVIKPFNEYRILQATEYAIKHQEEQNTFFK